MLADEGGGEPRGGEDRSQIVGVGKRLPQHEPVGMAADHDEGRITGLQTPDQVVAGTGAGAGNEHSGGHSISSTAPSDPLALSREHTLRRPWPHP
jgi:hypothetical protein